MANDRNKSSKRDVAPRYSDPFSALRAEMDSLFDSFIGGLPTFSGMFGSSGGRGFALTPHISWIATGGPACRVGTKLSKVAFQGVSGRRPCTSRSPDWKPHLAGLSYLLLEREGPARMEPAGPSARVALRLKPSPAG